MNGSGRPRSPHIFLALAALVAIYVAGTQAVHLAPYQGAVASWWPSAGIAVSLFALAPRRWWPALIAGVVVASGAANLTGGRTFEVSLVFGLANTAEAVVAAHILRRAGTPRFASLDDFLRLVRAAAVGALVFATAGALNIALLADGSFFETWRYLWPSHAASTLIIVPVALTLRQPMPERRLAELAIQASALFAVTLLVFAPDQPLALAFAPLPLLVWAALRLGVRTLTWELLGTSVIGTMMTAEGYGPFAADAAVGISTVAGAGAMVQLWLLCAALMSLPLTVTVEQRRQLLDEVIAREELFRRNFTESLTGMLLLKPHRERLQIVDANDAALRLLGDSRGPVVGRHLDRVINEPARVRAAAQELLSGREDGWTGQLGLVDRPRTRIDVSLSIISGGDQPVLAAQLLDVTAEHRARARIEAAEKLTSATLDTAACIIIVADMGGTVVRVNTATCGLTGYTEDQILGRPVWETIVPEYRVPLVKEIFSSPDGAAVPDSREADVARADGGVLRVVWNNNIVFDDEGNAAYVVMTGIDVTAERTAAGLVDHLLRASNTTALIGIDHRGVISLFNSGASVLLGYDDHEVVGRPFTDLLDPGDLATRTRGSREPGTFAALVESLGEQGETPPQDWTWLGAGGRRLTVSMTLSVAADASTARSGFLCVGRDVTEQRHSQAMLITALETERRAVERLRRLDAAKSEFVSTVSHELRTPVTSIIGYTELLTDGSFVKPDPAQLPLLETIARNGERLITICNDLLLIGQLEAGAAEMAREEVDLVALMQVAKSSLRHLARGRDLNLDFKYPSERTVVLGDRVQLERAVDNLLSNAVKFTDDGGHIQVRLEQNGAEARIVVRDTGIGIPEDEQSGLFQKFFRSSTAQAKAIQGAGLGLSIVSGI
ncbi:MAG TPA: PAS domain S-box protein, partial [Nocardioides sp.]|nr:PAS domain S-box protein [Nocardioides sp.]